MGEQSEKGDGTGSITDAAKRVKEALDDWTTTRIEQQSAGKHIVTKEEKERAAAAAEE